MTHSALDSQDYTAGHDASPNAALPFSDPFTPFSAQSHFSVGSSIDNDLRAIEPSEIAALELNLLVQGVGNYVKETLKNFAEGSAYEEITGLAFGENYDRQIADSLKQHFAEGNLVSLPQIQILDADTLNGANGAYAAELNTIFLSDAFIRNSSHQAVAKVLLEEIGHFIDDHINAIDAPGDEGDIFARLVLGQDLGLNELADLKQEDDSGYLWINGQSIAVEQDDTLSTARNIGTIGTSSRSVTGRVEFYNMTNPATADFQDYVRFYVDRTSNLQLDLTGLSQGATVYLLDNLGEIKGFEKRSGTNSKQITYQVSRGSYYAWITADYNAATNYTLTLKATPTPLDDSLSTARDLGTLSGTRSFTDLVGISDSKDYYRFYVGAASNFQLNVSARNEFDNGYFFPYLRDSAGNTVTYATSSSTSSEKSITRQLNAGTYYVEVGGSGSYNLALSAVPLDYSGNTRSTANNIGTLVTTRNFSDWVGSADPNDYYRFYVGTTSNFRLNLTGLSANANVQLLNSAGTTLQSSTLTGASSESIARQLSTGTYYVRVYPFSGNTTYNLALSATPVDRAGNTLGTARSIGTLSGTRSLTDWIGSVDTNDYYRFSIGTRSNFSLSLTGLSADADVQILNSAGNLLSSGPSGSYRTGTSSESISRQLNAGTYYARVYRYSGDTNYSLNFSTVALSNTVRLSSAPVNMWLYSSGARSNTGYIEAARGTTVVIHGWKQNDQSTEIKRLLREVNQQNTQVIALDWGSISNQPGVLDYVDGDLVPDKTAKWITPVAEWAQTTLSNLGILGSQITLVGHSLGTFVASEIGRLYGGVRSLIALDPAASGPLDVANYDLDGRISGTQAPVRFDSVAGQSLAFVVGDQDYGLAGSNRLAATAHTSFVVDNWGFMFTDPLTAQTTTHNAVVDLFTNAVDRGLVRLNNPLWGLPGYQINRYDHNGGKKANGSHEGRIQGRRVNGAWVIDGVHTVTDARKNLLGNWVFTESRSWIW